MPHRSFKCSLARLCGKPPTQRERSTEESHLCASCVMCLGVSGHTRQKKATTQHFRKSCTILSRWRGIIFFLCLCGSFLSCFCVMSLSNVNVLFRVPHHFSSSEVHSLDFEEGQAPNETSTQTSTQTALLSPFPSLAQSLSQALKRAPPPPPPPPSALAWRKNHPIHHPRVTYAHLN